MLVLSTGTDERLQHHLEKRGFAVTSLPLDDSAAWVSELLNKSYSAVVLNAVQGDQAWWQAIRVLKANSATRDLPLLCCAMTEQHGTVLEFNYLTKPVELADLARVLDQYWLKSDPVSAGHTILVVDDDPDTLELHARIIQSYSADHRVLRARSGREALTLLQQQPVDLVLLDLMMPEMNGFTLLQMMREDQRLREIPVIVITGRMLSEEDMALLNQASQLSSAKAFSAPMKLSPICRPRLSADAG